MLGKELQNGFESQDLQYCMNVEMDEFDVNSKL